MSALRTRLDRLADSIVSRRPPPPPPDFARLSARVDSLEAMLEGLQDSVDRLATRHDADLADLSRRLGPGELARVLSDDARKRGI